MEEPNYEKYSLEQLLDIKAHIDKESYPERYQRIINILEDPMKLEKLRSKQELELEKREVEKVENEASFGAIAIWVYGAIVIYTGIAFGRRGSEFYIDSIYARIAILLICLFTGYRYLMNKINK